MGMASARPTQIYSRKKPTAQRNHTSAILSETRGNMASQTSTMDYIVEQIETAGTVTARKMFGEYAIYCNERLVALVCDDKLFVKPTVAGRAFIGQVTEAPPYPGAKPYFFISGERWEDRVWLSTLVKVSAAELPLPVKKTPTKSPKKRLEASRKK